MYRIESRHCDLRAIMESGQVFRMYSAGEQEYMLYAGDRKLRLRQDGERITFYCDEDEYHAVWRDYFDLNRNYDTIQAEVMDAKGEEFLHNAAYFGSGIRVLHQDLWEMLITFIISQQKQIPSIRKCVEALCERYGKKHEEEWYGFPEPEAIAEGGMEGLNGLSLGYRDKYIFETARRFMIERPDKQQLAALGFERAREYLKGYSGVGEKVANCVCLFGVDFVDAFPIDVHIKDILYREYYKGGKEKDKLTLREYEELVEGYFARYKGFRGIVQQWIFAYELHLQGRKR